MRVKPGDLIWIAHPRGARDDAQLMKYGRTWRVICGPSRYDPVYAVPFQLTSAEYSLSESGAPDSYPWAEDEYEPYVGQTEE